MHGAGQHEDHHRGDGASQKILAIEHVFSPR
jgi:hypothetical protein